MKISVIGSAGRMVCAVAFAAALSLFFHPDAMAQRKQVALKTNLLYWATSTPNIGMEVSVADRHSVGLSYGLNPWKFKGESKIRHWLLMPEYRYWFCQAFSGWFVGVHLMGGEFNMGETELPLGIAPGLKSGRYEGWYAGGGISAGYQWIISEHWNFELSAGAGYDYVKYDRFGCGYCGEMTESAHRNYFGPTKAVIGFTYIF